MLRTPRPADAAEFIELNQASAAHYQPWVTPPVTAEQFASYLARAARDDTACFLVCQAGSGAIMGAVNLSQIFYGPLCSAYMGYYLGAPYTRQGYMAEALRLMLAHAFGELGLHRVEANIQPENQASIALARSLGFTREGFSRRYLKIMGEWRDHERWAILAEDTQP